MPVKRKNPANLVYCNELWNATYNTNWKKIRMNSKQIKSKINLIIITEGENYTELIESPKAGDVNK